MPALLIYVKLKSILISDCLLFVKALVYKRYVKKNIVSCSPNCLQVNGKEYTCKQTIQRTKKERVEGIAFNASCSLRRTASVSQIRMLIYCGTEGLWWNVPLGSGGKRTGYLAG